MIFLTEQTEGRPIKPHSIDYADFDLCDSCYEYMLSNMRIISVITAQGHDRFYLRKGEKHG